MEGFVNQFKKYFKQTESLVKELHKNLIVGDEGQIYITPFNTSSSGEVLRITGKGVMKNFTVAVTPGGDFNNLIIQIDGKIKMDINGPSSSTYSYFRYFNDGKNGYLTINENIKFNNSIAIVVNTKNGGIIGHIMYTLDN